VANFALARELEGYRFASLGPNWERFLPVSGPEKIRKEELSSDLSDSRRHQRTYSVAQLCHQCALESSNPRYHRVGGRSGDGKLRRSPRSHDGKRAASQRRGVRLPRRFGRTPCAGLRSLSLSEIPATALAGTSRPSVPTAAIQRKSVHLLYPLNSCNAVQAMSTSFFDSRRRWHLQRRASTLR